MCRHPASRSTVSRTSAARPGSRLEDGRAHVREHRAWSRRDFLTGLGLAAGGALCLGGTSVRALAGSPLLTRLRRVASERVLVLIQLCGGNDGLNTLIPVEDSLYYRARPRLAVAKPAALPLTDELGLHPALAGLVPLYQDGRVALVQNVGYPEPDLSHFRSTDVWLSASDARQYLTTGWAGRSLEHAFPAFEEEPPGFPPAVQLGGLSSMIFQGGAKNMGMSLSNPALFERLAATGTLYDAADVPETAYGGEIAFMRTVANDAFRYATAIRQAAEAGMNRADYARDNYLAENLAIVARLIKGRLGARVYHVSLGGFDTHADQKDAHAALLRRLADAVAAFQQDLAADGWDDHVLTMTFSEFGRRVEENGSRGTDHGTAAPLFLFGRGVNGGLYGRAPALDDLDGAGNLKHGVDFRAVYATVLREWFGFDAPTVDAVLGHPFEPLGFVAAPASPTSVHAAEVPERFVLEQNYPNPFNPSTTIPYALSAPAHVRLRVYDLRGRLVQTLAEGLQAAGRYAVSFDAGYLPSGPYLYRLELPGGTQARTMLLLR